MATIYISTKVTKWQKNVLILNKLVDTSNNFQSTSLWDGGAYKLICPCICLSLGLSRGSNVLKECEIQTSVFAKLKLYIFFFQFVNI